MSVDLVDTSTHRWKVESQREYARVLLGTYAHYCAEFGGKPVDETIRTRWPCDCAAVLTNGRVRKGANH